ncbi:hypothetical protein DW909_06770 [Bifidobacterium bifidum]|nr:hypothetical protein DW909_06770 [Bifidobacterium bifidum]
MPNQSANEDGIIIRADSRTTLTVVALAALSAVYPVIAANLLSVSNVSFELFRARLSDNIGAGFHDSHQRFTMWTAAA